MEIMIGSRLARTQPWSKVQLIVGSARSFGAADANSILDHRRPFQFQQPIPTTASLSSITGRSTSPITGPVIVHHCHQTQLQKRNYHSLHRSLQLQLQPFSCIPPPLSQVQVQATRQLAIRSKNRNNRSNKKKGGVDPNAPLLNEHLIAELFNKKKQDDANVTAETYEVRLIVDQGYQKKRNADDDDEDSDDDDSEDEDNTNTPPAAASATPTTQITTLASAITIAHSLSLDLMEVTLQISPPVIKAVDFDKWLYEQKKKAQAAASKKKKEGGGAISDRPLKEFKFRAGIADHDLERKTNNMLKYLEKGHAIRVTLTARMRSLKNDAMAITTTLERVKELVGDRAVEVRGMKANDRKSYGSLLLHPSKGSGK